MHKLRPVIMVFICITGALLNIVFPVLKKPYFPLYLDTILTVTLTLTGGLFWGALTGALTNLIYNTLFFWRWEGYLFALCNIATAVVTWLFMRLFPHDLGWFCQSSVNSSKPRNDFVSIIRSSARETSAPMFSALFKSRRFEAMADRVIVLVLLSFGLCITMSVLGGLISALIQIFNPAYIKEPFVVSAAMSDWGYPLILTEILSRFPMNIIDRLITVFIGYGIAVIIPRKIIFPFTQL